MGTIKVISLVIVLKLPTQLGLGNLPQEQPG